MRKSILLVAFIGVELLSAIVPAAATDQSAAVAMCEKNPNCGHMRSGGGVNLWVKTDAGGTQEIWCPNGGECECISCSNPQRSQPHLGYLIVPPFTVPQSLSSTSDSSPAYTPSAPAPSGGSQPPIIY
jgi:hypothetical protein